jgi:hypothetical protein
MTAPTTNPIVVAVAEAMKQKRKELLSQPLERIWMALAEVAIAKLETQS